LGIGASFVCGLFGRALGFGLSPLVGDVDAMVVVAPVGWTWGKMAWFGASCQFDRRG
jgi:hypothetical protein